MTASFAAARRPGSSTRAAAPSRAPARAPGRRSPRRARGGVPPPHRRAGREDELLREADAAHAREALRSAPARHDPEVDLRLAELCLRRRVPEVARERELAAAAEREPVDRGDRRLAHRLEQLACLVTERAPRLCAVGVEAAHVLDVRTRDECAVTRARQHDDARIVVRGERAQRSRTSVSVATSSAFIASGRSIVTIATPSAFSTRTLSDGDFRAQEVDDLTRRRAGVKTSATPRAFSSAASSIGIVPPTTTSTSSAPFSRSPSRIRGRASCARRRGSRCRPRRRPPAPPSRRSARRSGATRCRSLPCPRRARRAR